MFKLCVKWNITLISVMGSNSVIKGLTIQFLKGRCYIIGFILTQCREIMHYGDVSWNLHWNK